MLLQSFGTFALHTSTTAAVLQNFISSNPACPIDNFMLHAQQLNKFIFPLQEYHHPKQILPVAYPGLWACVCVGVCVRGKPRTYNKGEQWLLGWRLLSANVLGWKTCTNLMGDAYKSLSPTTKGTIEGNNMRSSVYTLHKTVRLYSHTVRGHFSIGTIGPRESVLCSQLSSDVVHVQSL